MVKKIKVYASYYLEFERDEIQDYLTFMRQTVKESKYLELVKRMELLTVDVSTEK